MTIAKVRGCTDRSITTLTKLNSFYYFFFMQFLWVVFSPNSYLMNILSFFIFGINILLDPRMDRLDFGGQRPKSLSTNSTSTQFLRIQDCVEGILSTSGTTTWTIMSKVIVTSLSVFPVITRELIRLRLRISFFL